MQELAEILTAELFLIKDTCNQKVGSWPGTVMWGTLRMIADEH